MEKIKYSLVIPVYKNEESLDRLLAVLTEFNDLLNNQLEVVFVVDGSPDQCYALLSKRLKDYTFRCQILLHSRNFGSFAAIRTGLSAAEGGFFAVMAADLQEPPELILGFFQSLSNEECDVAVGFRESRNDPPLSKISANLFWSFYRKFIVKDIPQGGVDIFGCNKMVRDTLVSLNEARSSLVALLFWVGFTRKEFPYSRNARQEGKSAWTLRKKLEYLSDSIFAFTDLPIKLIIQISFLGVFLSIFISLLVLIGHLTGSINVPGYVPIVLLISFFSMINLLAIGLVGNYAWRAYENTKSRPHAIISRKSNNFTR